MPKLPNDQQYQLWALIDGKPSDLGVFDATDNKVILKMKNTKKAQAFAILSKNMRKPLSYPREDAVDG